MLVKSKLKYIQTLGQKKFRQEEKVFIAEGPKLVTELLKAKRAVVKEVLALKEWIDENTELLSRVTCTVIAEQELEKISQLSTPNKVLAIVQQFDNGEEADPTGKVILVLDTIQDPGNLGTIIRIADWFGIEQVVCSNDSADVYNSKVVQASMGSISRVKIFYTELASWLSSQTGTTICAAALDGEDITGMKKMAQGIIIIGNESKGISRELLNLATLKITIPGKGNAESLNAAVATGIILSHLWE